ncbi:MAG TPA: hypothetical protein VMV18_06220 [bacterium]|nr:hypothetical protein [bacterium]
MRASGQVPSAAPLDIGTRRELFIDDYLIDRFSGGARLRLHAPERRNIALVHDAPWEGCGSGYHTVFQDGDAYRMYYKAWNHEYNPRTAHPLVIAYAESRDGIQWTKPDLGLVEFSGSRHNNIVLNQSHGGIAHDFSPFRDPNPAAPPSARYKAVGYGKPHGLYAFQSADALHWELLQDAPILTDGAFDTQNIAFWDARVGKYRVYIRVFVNGRRDVKTALSDDFRRWSAPESLTYSGGPEEQLYTNQVKPYYRAPHVYIGFPARYVDRGWSDAVRRLPELAEREQRAAASTRYGTAVTDSLLMSSRDGIRFRRWDEAFLRPGLRTRYNWSYGDNYIAWHVVETASEFDDAPRELSLYATESYFTEPESRLRRYTLRLDGFGSVAAPLSGGELITHPFTFQGDRLLLNFSTSAGGSVRVELQDSAGKAIPGYALAECPVIFGDHLEYAAGWNGSAGPRALSGKPIRLRIELKDADIFAFRFA